MELQILLSNYRSIKEASLTDVDNEFKQDAIEALTVLTPHFEALQQLEQETIEKLKLLDINHPMITSLLPDLS